MFENLEGAVQAIRDGITLKADYTEELEMLDDIEGNIAVFRTLGTPLWRCNDLRAEIKGFREWFKEQTA